MYLDNTSKTTQYTWVTYVIQVKLGLRKNYLNNSPSHLQEPRGRAEQSKENGVLSYRQPLKHPALLFPWQENLLGALPGGSSLEIEKKKGMKRKKQPSAVFSENSPTPADWLLPRHGDTSSNGAQAASTQHAGGSWLILFDSSKKCALPWMPADYFQYGCRWKFH